MLSTLTLATEETPTDQIGPGLLAFLIVLLLGVATFFLLRSMLHHLRKVPPTFDDQDGGAVGERADAASDLGGEDSSGASPGTGVG